jgi:hypothetical protein
MIISSRHWIRLTIFRSSFFFFRNPLVIFNLGLEFLTGLQRIPRHESNNI